MTTEAQREHKRAYDAVYRAVNRGKRKESNAKWYAANHDKAKENNAKWYAANHDKAKENNAKWCAANRGKRKENNAKWCAANRGKRRESNAKWYAANREKVRRRHAEYRHDNRGRSNALNRAYKIARLHRTPPWANMEAIAAVYVEAAETTRRTGIPHEVDHIIPLQGRTISGLHVPNNLQIITATANRKKSNSYEGEKHEWQATFCN